MVDSICGNRAADGSMGRGWHDWACSILGGFASFVEGVGEFPSASGASRLAEQFVAVVHLWVVWGGCDGLLSAATLVEREVVKNRRVIRELLERARVHSREEANSRGHEQGAVPVGRHGIGIL